LYICNSETTKKIAIDRGFDDKKCVVIPVGVEDKFNNSIPKTEARKEIINKYNFELDDFILLTTGRLIKRKGVYWFIKNVFTKLPKNIRYVIAGAGAEEIRITNLIQQKKLEERIVLAGKVSDADLITLYKGSDVFVMPNITVPNDVEGFGIVAIEASMSGLPVIASNVQGISDAVIDRSNGYLLREKDGNGYISRIKTYNKNRSLLTEDGSVFSVFTKNKYNWESVVSIYKKYLNSV
jgi:glycosyltransferase involved in cell wall biosynthesis